MDTTRLGLDLTRSRGRGSVTADADSPSLFVASARTAATLCAPITTWAAVTGRLELVMQSGLSS
jgi:hypothetical protein